MFLAGIQRLKPLGSGRLRSDVMILIPRFRAAKVEH